MKSKRNYTEICKQEIENQNNTNSPSLFETQNSFIAYVPSFDCRILVQVGLRCDFEAMRKYMATMPCLSDDQRVEKLASLISINTLKSNSVIGIPVHLTCQDNESFKAQILEYVDFCYFEWLESKEHTFQELGTLTAKLFKKLFQKNYVK